MQLFWPESGAGHFPPWSFVAAMQELYGRHFLPRLGALMPSPTRTSRPLIRTGLGPSTARDVGAAVTTVAPLPPVRGGYPRSYFGATQP
jgi:hypothetical protein